MTSARKYYSIYGLRVASELECSSALSIGGPAEVTVRVGDVPDRLCEVTAEGVWYQGNRNEFLLEIPPVARYWVKNGNEIVVAPAASGSSSEVETFLIGSAFAALLHQRGTWTVHASAVEWADKCVLFAGPSGVGKSTLAAAFELRGRRVIADDVTPIVSRGNAPVALPGQPRLRLWSDVVNRLGIDKRHLRAIRRGLKKYELQRTPVAASELEVARVYVLNPSNRPDFQLTRLRGQAKFQRLYKNTYKAGMLERLGQGPRFRHIGTLARTTPVVDVRRPSARLRLEELADLVERDMTA